MTSLRTHCWSGNTTMHSVCDFELHFTVKMLSWQIYVAGNTKTSVGKMRKTALKQQNCRFFSFPFIDLRFGYTRT